MPLLRSHTESEPYRIGAIQNQWSSLQFNPQQSWFFTRQFRSRVISHCNSIPKRVGSLLDSSDRSHAESGAIQNQAIQNRAIQNRSHTESVIITVFQLTTELTSYSTVQIGAMQNQAIQNQAIQNRSHTESVILLQTQWLIEVYTGSASRRGLASEDLRTEYLTRIKAI